MKTALVVPDMHCGYRGTEPLHDPRALDLALQVARRLHPEEVILLGDNLDLAAFSMKFPSTPDLRQTTQRSLDTLRAWLVRLRLAVGHKARIVYLCGNHEARIEKLLSQVAPELLGLHAPGDVEPALSVPGLLRLSADDLRIKCQPYGMIHWLFGKVLCQHGDTARKGGGRTVAGLLDSNPVDQVCGHVHRAEVAGRTLPSPDGPRTVWALSPGTLARLDGVVPAATSQVDWQQGLGLVRLDRHAHVTMTLLPIQSGSIVYPGGRLLVAHRSPKP